MVVLVRNIDIFNMENFLLRAFFSNQLVWPTYNMPVIGGKGGSKCQLMDEGQPKFSRIKLS